jgi:hypothetical protein
VGRGLEPLGNYMVFDLIWTKYAVCMCTHHGHAIRAKSVSKTRPPTIINFAGEPFGNNGNDLVVQVLSHMFTARDPLRAGKRKGDQNTIICVRSLWCDAEC